MEKRLSRLRTGNHYALLAMDHGLSVGFGDIVESTDIEQTIDSCQDNISGVVLTYGFARHVTKQSQAPLVLQCFGAPSGNPRAKIATVEQALRLDAAAVAVQIDLKSKFLTGHVREVAEFVATAHNMGVPVLFMMSGVSPGSVEELSSAIRVAHEIGADLIKIPCNTSALANSADVDQFRSVLASAPPTLFAGGEFNPDIAIEMKAAMQLGFSGFCIGRSIFQADSPGAIASLLLDEL